MTGLPPGWAFADLLDVAALLRGVTYSKSDASDAFFVNSVPVLRANNLQERGFDLRDLVYVPDSLVSEAQRIQTGDVVVATSSGSIKVVGKAVQALADIHAGFGAFCGLLRPVKQIEAHYFGHFFSTDAYRAAVSSMARGVNINNLKRSHFAALSLPVAPRNEQKRIADKLDAVLARVDACRERLDRVPAILKRFRQSVLAAATSGKLTEDWREANSGHVDATGLAAKVHSVHHAAGGHKAGNASLPTDGVHDLSEGMFPQGWTLLTLRDLVMPDRPITYGILMPGPEIEGGVKYVRVADFPSDRLNLNTIRKTSPKIDEEFKRARLRSGDLLLSIRGTVGRLVVVPDELEKANITQDTARLTIQPHVSRDYVLWYLRSELAQFRMKGAVRGVAVRGINIGDVRALQVPLPSREEQDEIVGRVETLFAYADRLEARYAAACAQIERLTPALLAKAFRGELVPQDPNDEPASDLLDRIRAARTLVSDMSAIRPMAPRFPAKKRKAKAR
ncbi:MAG: restriction endonuclease subunit S [Chitinivibrionia bacterium]|nr:restriction endonuclease subunit S [Chitinivibrionia bacterium]